MLNKILLFSAISSLLLTGCGGSSDSFTTPSSSTTPANNNAISQNNFTLSFADTAPKYADLSTNPGTISFTAVETQVVVTIGDINNQLITGEKTIHFQSEWGLIDPFCTTADGTCSVTWKSGSSDDMPSNFLVNIIAYSDNGQEAFNDLNGNGFFDDGDTFTDNEEPFLDVNENGVFDANGDKIIDTINGNDLTGVNATHDVADGLFNGPKCIHSTLCSTTLIKSTVWESGSLRLTGADTFTVGGKVAGLNGSTVNLQNNNNEVITVDTDGDFTFTIKQFPGTTYSVISSTTSTGKACVVSNGSGTLTQNVTDITVDCN